MGKKWHRFTHSPYPYQDYKPFPDDAIVLVGSDFGSRIDLVKNLWWGYADGLEQESMIFYAIRLDRPKEKLK